jgi:uncharacterized membrane protein
LTVIAIVLIASIGFSLKAERLAAAAEPAGEALEPRAPDRDRHPPEIEL